MQLERIYPDSRVYIETFPAEVSCVTDSLNSTKFSLFSIIHHYESRRLLRRDSILESRCEWRYTSLKIETQHCSLREN